MDLAEFWNDKHQRQNRQWLTGSTVTLIHKFYGVDTRAWQGRKILEIGVGVGSITNSLAEIAGELYCADISSVALDNVKKHARQTFLSKDISQVPPVDIVLCHLVLVHCDDAEVLRLLSSIRLLDGGKIYCQFSCLKEPNAIKNASPSVQEQLTNAGPHFFRDPADIEKLITQAGLTIGRQSQCDPGQFQNWTGQFWKLYELERK
jgi:ubiquinone/menaquinone biosynthesis C-methylase UbiE